jgi:hypothetical protein
MGMWLWQRLSMGTLLGLCLLVNGFMGLATLIYLPERVGPVAIGQCVAGVVGLGLLVFRATVRIRAIRQADTP